MSRTLARAALVCGIAGLPLWLLSYAWVPFAQAGHEPEFVRYAVVGGEVGALMAGVLAAGLGLAARGRTRPGTPEHCLASRGLMIAALVLALVLVPNLLAGLWTVW